MNSEEFKEQILHQEKLIEEYNKTSKILELKVAHFGAHTPPYMLKELQECEEKIQICKKEVEKLKAKQKQLAEATRREAKLQDLIHAHDHVNLIEDAQVPLVKRLEYARLLGQADKRVGVCTLPEYIDDQYWCGPFPEGKYQIVAGKSLIELREFRVARYPVTVWQFQQFVDDRGYTNKRWWKKEGWQSNTSAEFLLWNIPGWNAGNQPVIGISWYEATAFCQWLTARVRSAGWLSNNYEIRLPTEAEWVVAAMWDIELKQMCKWRPPTNEYWQNVQEVNIINNTTSPVGLFSQGASPCGALDMAGNVWEWCSSSRESFPAQAHIIKQNVKMSTRDLVLRGGSWKETNKCSGWNARSVASLPTTTLNDRGFRVFMCSRTMN